MNKDYNLKASERLMGVRQTNWAIQYWLLIASLILMYPTPLLNNLRDSDNFKDNLEVKDHIGTAQFWLFWLGLFVTPPTGSQQASNWALYFLVTILVLDRITQGWQKNRFGCTISKIREFKELEEKVRLF